MPMLSKRPAVEADKPFSYGYKRLVCVNTPLHSGASGRLIWMCGTLSMAARSLSMTAMMSAALPLRSIVTTCASQRRGIGSKILSGVIADAEDGEILLRLSVLATNPALDFYLRHGFRIHQESAERRYLVR
jgi:GNAT superfamily N-acetyltransferase